MGTVTPRQRDQKGLGRTDWLLGHTFLRPFTCPVPETRFFHAGMNVYKFKIKYGNTMNINTDLHESIISEELQDAIRVILGNLDNLCPFTTEHLIIFPYLNRWERVSDLRFMHGDAFLIPYPYVCTVYVELNFLKQSIFGGVEYRDACTWVKNRDELRENLNLNRAVKYVQEDNKEISWPSPYLERSEAKIATRKSDTPEQNIQFGKAHLEEAEFYGSTTLTNKYENTSLRKPVEYVRMKKETSQQKGQVLFLEKGSGEEVTLKKKGFLALLKSILFPPVLQSIFDWTQ